MTEKSYIPSTISHLPLVVIVGPTACGKTSLSIKLAKKYNGEIISADSRAIYKEMNIGTAKPNMEEQNGVPHWGLNLVEPGEYFSVADFKDYANQKIDEIRSRGHVPFLVGGTGLYVDSVVFDYKFGRSVDKKMVLELQHMSVLELQAECARLGVALPENNKNKRYLMRSIENQGIIPNKLSKPLANSIIVGITTENSVLRTRIEKRSEQLFDNGVVKEGKLLGDKYGWDSEAMKSNIYPLIHNYLDGNMSLEEVKARLVTLDWRLAKRQMTWLRRNKFIQWLILDDAKSYLNDQLANYMQP